MKRITKCRKNFNKALQGVHEGSERQNDNGFLNSARIEFALTALNNNYKENKYEKITKESNISVRSYNEYYDDENQVDCFAKPTCLKPTGLEIEWIQCDICKKWFHLHCLGLNPLPEDKNYFCEKCEESTEHILNFKSPVKNDLKYKRKRHYGNSDIEIHPNNKKRDFKIREIAEDSNLKEQNTCDSGIHISQASSSSSTSIHKKRINKNNSIVFQSKLSYENNGKIENEYHCKFCFMEFISLRNLNVHVGCVHDGIEKYQCHVCAKITNSAKNLRKHFVTVHKFKCDSCGEYFGHSNSLERHIESVHKGLKHYQCDICDISFVNSNDLKEHICNNVYGKENTCHEEKIEISSTKDQNLEFICEVCSKAFSQISDLELHIDKEAHWKICESLTAEKVFEGLDFENDSNKNVLIPTPQHSLKENVIKEFNKNSFGTEIQHGLIVYRCDFCNVSFKLVKNLKNHIENAHYKPNTPNVLEPDLCQELKIENVMSMKNCSFGNWDHKDLFKNGDNEMEKRKCNFCKTVFREIPEESFCFEGCYIP